MKRVIYLPYFENKKATVLGLGLLGRGVGDTEFLLEAGADVICTDTRSEEKLKESIAQIKNGKHTNLKLVIGENRMEDFENRDFVLTCPGMPLGYEYLEHAKSNNIPIFMSASLLSDIVMKNLPNVTIIGVTGTRGKSTTTQMIAHILKSANSRVHLGGNIRGIANLPLLKEIEDDEYLLLELDSWQLQGFGDQKISPHIAVFTNFMDDHMNYYKNDKELYFNDKANVYRYQKDLDVLIVSEEAAEEIKKRDENQEMVLASNSYIETSLLGEHNQTAAKLAYEVASQCGIDDETIREAIKTFKAVDGRLEDLGEFRGVRIFNDNNGTTPNATMAGIKAIVETYNRKPVLIMGGSDKGLPIEELENVIKENTKEVIYLSGTGTERMTLPKKYEFEELKDCIGKAFEVAEQGDIILFSPAFASFSKYFSNEYEKNDEFVKLVQKYA